MPITFVLCDVFADRPFAGNQLAVFLDARSVTDEDMSSVAKEFGWSEITFVTRDRDDLPPRVRIWTPDSELPFAGHPTIGTAVVLASAGQIEIGWSTLQLGIGPIAVEVTAAHSAGGHASMTQRTPELGKRYDDRHRLVRALDLSEQDLVDELPAQVVSTGLPHFMVPVRSLQALGRARPVPDLFPEVTSDAGVQWAYLFCTDTPGSAAVARTRLVAMDREDPATGSAAGPLGAYLVHYGLHRGGTMDIEQGIEMGRPSRITVDVPVEGGEIGPVRVSGQVHIWAQGSVEDGVLASSKLEV